MKTDLVHTVKGEVFTDSKVISEMLEVEHKVLVNTIEKTLNRQKNNGTDKPLKYPQKFIESSFKNKMGRTYKMYELNEQAYLKLAMQLSGYEKAEIVQDQIIEAFSIMKEALLNQQNNSWIEKRSETKQIRQIQTDVIKNFVNYATSQGSKSAIMYYQNITKMTNKALELLIQTKHGKPLRDLATITELGFISVVDNRAMQAIEDGMNRELPYREIYKFAKEEVEKLVDSLAFKSITR
jgi:phage regulator Rha-like protein